MCKIRCAHINIPAPDGLATLILETYNVLGLARKACMFEPLEISSIMGPSCHFVCFKAGLNIMFVIREDEEAYPTHICLRRPLNRFSGLGIYVYTTGLRVKIWVSWIL